MRTITDWRKSTWDPKRALKNYSLLFLTARQRADRGRRAVNYACVLLLRGKKGYVYLGHCKKERVAVYTLVFKTCTVRFPVQLSSRGLWFGFYARISWFTLTNQIKLRFLIKYCVSGQILLVHIPHTGTYWCTERTSISMQLRIFYLWKLYEINCYFIVKSQKWIIYINFICTTDCSCHMTHI